MEEKNEQVKEEIKDDQSSENTQEKVEESKEEPLTIEQLSALAKGLQGGYTQTRQDLAEIRESLQAIADAKNAEIGAKPGDEDYVTVGKLKEVVSSIFSEQAQLQNAQAQSNQKLVDSTISDLRAEGLITSDQEQDAFLKFGAKFIEKTKDPDLNKVAIAWREVKEARDEGKKVITEAQKKAKQEEGSKIGSSSKVTGEESKGVDINKIRNARDFMDFVT